MRSPLLSVAPFLEMGDKYTSVFFISKELIMSFSLLSSLFGLNLCLLGVTISMVRMILRGVDMDMLLNTIL